MNIEAFDVVLLINPSGGGRKTAEMLIEREVRAVVCAEDNISNRAMEAFIESNTPVLFQMPIRQIDDIAVTFYDELEQAIQSWEEQRNKIVKQKTESQLSTLIADYQEKRKKELKDVYQAERQRKQKETPKQKIKFIESKEIDEE
jgi:predicted RNase H-like nuclease (RuvC/YqgF family)